VPKILIVAATAFEIDTVLKTFKIETDTSCGLYAGSHNVSALITGVGMVNTAYYLGRHSHAEFDIIINAGICGAVNLSLKIGEVVDVVSDTLSELGAENDADFISFKDLNLGGTSLYLPKNTSNMATLKSLKKVNAITVNKVHGNTESIKKMIALHNPDIETMEGAAFFRGTEHMQAKCLQIRSVSNYVQKRDKSKWNVPLAIRNLNNFVIQLIKTINS